ncbi:thioredoxin domain-containing protein [Nitratifractor sp.]
MKRLWQGLFAAITLLSLGSLHAEDFKYTNALIHEESPYLQQHAHNPVQWMPWGKAAFEKARREHKPIFLSIGYSTCHWCHVMEEESFEDPEVARILNRHFVAIKVDREERPQIDSYYQHVYRLLNRRPGGWPLTILLTPDRHPFFAATYIPRNARYGQRGLLDLLQAVAKDWAGNPEEIEAFAAKVQEAMKQGRVQKTNQSPVGEDLIHEFLRSLRGSFDPLHGGWAGAPKFPRATTITTLLKLTTLDGNDTGALKMALHTLDKMAKGGIYDQVEGGFFRYSTDARWRIPHFEKMLYTNAELIEAYALAARLTGTASYRRIVRESVEDLLAHYRDPSGLFYGASDADSLDPEKGEKEEGYYYSYDYGDTLEALKKAGVNNAEERMKAYGLEKEGNLPDFRSHLARRGPVDEDLRKELARLRRGRPYPFIDRKMIPSWNALLAHALFVAAPLDARYGRLGQEIVDAIGRELTLHGRLYHQKLPGKAPKVPALLEDYSFTIDALIDAYEWSFDPRYLHEADRLLSRAKKLFYRQGRWYDAVGAFANPLSLEGGSYRSPLAVLAEDYLRLALLEDRLDYREEARRILRGGAGILRDYPAAAPKAVEVALALQKGYVLVKAPRKELDALRREIRQRLDDPFLLYKASDAPLYQACRIDRCFLYDKDRKRFIEKLTKELRRGE